MQAHLRLSKPIAYFGAEQHRLQEDGNRAFAATCFYGSNALEANHAIFRPLNNCMSVVGACGASSF